MKELTGQETNLDLKNICDELNLTVEAKNPQKPNKMELIATIEKYNGVETVELETGRVIVSNGDLTVPLVNSGNKLKDPDGIRGKNGGMSVKDRAKHDYQKTCASFPDKVKEMKGAIIDRIVQGKTPKFNVVLKII